MQIFSVHLLLFRYLLLSCSIVLFGLKTTRLNKTTTTTTTTTCHSGMLPPIGRSFTIPQSEALPTWRSFVIPEGRHLVCREMRPVTGGGGSLVLESWSTRTTQCFGPKLLS